MAKHASGNILLLDRISTPCSDQTSIKPRPPKHSRKEDHADDGPKRALKYDTPIKPDDKIKTDHPLAHNMGQEWPRISPLIEKPESLTIYKKYQLISAHHEILDRLSTKGFPISIISQIFGKIPHTDVTKYLSMLSTYIPTLEEITKDSNNTLNPTSLPYLLKNSRDELPMKIWLLSYYSKGFASLSHNFFNLIKHTSPISSFIEDHPISTHPLNPLSTEKMVQNFADLIVFVLQTIYTTVTPMKIEALTNYTFCTFTNIRNPTAPDYKLLVTTLYKFADYIYPYDKSPLEISPYTPRFCETIIEEYTAITGEVVE